MFRSRSNLGFPRKIVAYYLLFCLVAVGWLAMGMLLTSHTVIDSRTTSASLTRLGRTAAALELEYLCRGEVGFQEVLQSSQWAEGLQNCSVVSLEGIIQANTEGETVGQTVIEPQGSRLRWGNVSGIQYQDANGRTLSEYRVPLIAHEDHFGSLRITVRQLDFWSTLAEIVRVAPAVVLVPLGLIGIGGLLLARLASPLAQVDGQLRSIALQRPSNKIRLEPLPAKDAISIGWNRIADLLQQDIASGGGQ